MPISNQLRDTTLAGVPPLELSFAQTRRRLAAALTRWQCSATPQGSEAQWEELLRAVALERQPRRRRRPSEPHAKRHVWESFPPLRGSRAAARQRLAAAALGDANMKS